MHQAIAPLAFARFTGKIGDASSGAALDARTAARGGGTFDPACETQNKHAGEEQPNRYCRMV